MPSIGLSYIHAARARDNGERNLLKLSRDRKTGEVRILFRTVATEDWRDIGYPLSFRFCLNQDQQRELCKFLQRSTK